MDTSIIVVIAIVVVFVVAVPTMIRRSATELSRVDIDRVPDEARVIDADLHNPCRDHTARARVFHADTTIEPAVPGIVAEPLGDSPQLRLSAPIPELSVIDGHAEQSHSGRTLAEATHVEATPRSPRDHESQHQSLPVAVGQARPTYLVDVSHERAEASRPSNVHRLHPAVHAVFNQSGPGTQQSGAQQPGANGGDHLGGGAIPLHPRGRTTGSASPGQHSSAGMPSQPGRDLRTSKRTFGADEEHSMTENKTTLQESMSALGTMIRGFALVLLVSLLGILVTGVLAIFSVVHPALIGVFGGLSVVSLIIVRTLNLRKWELKRQIRELETTPATAPAVGTSPRQSPPAPNPPAGKTTSVTRAVGGAPAASAAPTTAGETRTAGSTAVTGGSTAATGGRAASTTSAAAPSATAASTTSAGSTKAAQARAVIERNVSAKRAREEATTGEIPIVHIRSEAAAGHTTRQVLLTGPIPVVEDESEKAAEPEASTAAEPKTAIEPGTTAGSDSDATTGSMTVTGSATDGKAGPGLGTTVLETTAQRDPGRTHAAQKTGAAESRDGVRAAAGDAATDAAAGDATAAAVGGPKAVSDPFTQRLRARDAWSPTPLPTPSYVDAPEVEHPLPAATKADVTSYEIEPRSREDIAAQFAAELGYRPELSDSAREEGPLGHGRTAIRTSKAADLGAVNDVLARRRA